MKTKVITARLNEQAGLKMEYLKRHLGTQSTTQILMKAVDTLYNTVKEKETQKSPYELLEELNLLGCFEGEANLSQAYKSVLSESLKKKHRIPKTKKKV